MATRVASVNIGVRNPAQEAPLEFLQRRAPTQPREAYRSREGGDSRIWRTVHPSARRHSVRLHSGSEPSNPALAYYSPKVGRTSAAPALGHRPGGKEHHAAETQCAPRSISRILEMAIANAPGRVVAPVSDPGILRAACRSPAQFMLRSAIRCDPGLTSPHESDENRLPIVVNCDLVETAFHVTLAL